MRQISVLLIGLLYFGYAQGQIELKKSKVTVAGKIENATDRTLGIINLELIGSERINVKINEDGSFHKVFDVLSPHDNYLKYNNDLSTVFLAPGDSIYITADGENFQNTIQFSGPSASLNVILHKFFNEFASLIHSEGFFNTMFNPDPVEAKSSFIAFFNKVDEKIELIRNEHQLNDRALKWIEAYSKYRLGEELLQYGRKSKATLPDNYYDFIDEYLDGHVVSDFYCSQYYRGFLQEYYLHKLGKDTVLESMLEILPEQEFTNTSLELYFTRTLYSIMSRGGHKFADSLLTGYSNFVSNQSFIEYLQQAITERSNEKHYSIDDLIALEFVGEIFSEIKEKHQGKVLYIDFWGTWCSPCIREFPASNALHDELNNQDIAFVYLCCSSKKEDWQKQINKYDLDGIHYLLNDDQYNVIAAEFGFSGVPVYMMIDKEGVIVNKYAGRPSEPSTRTELITLIGE